MGLLVAPSAHEILVPPTRDGLTKILEADS